MTTSIQHGYCTQCHTHCGVQVITERGRLVKVAPDPSHPNAGICVIGASVPNLIHRQDRLTRPLLRTAPKGERDGGWQPISWDEALHIIADKLKSIMAETGPESIAFSKPTSSASASVDWQPFLHRLANRIGTPNVVSTSYMCQWSRDYGSSFTYGKGIPEPDYEHSGIICIWGHNPAHTSLQTWRRIRESQERGAKLIVVDPRQTTTADAADLWIAPRPGTDGALIFGLIRLIMHGQGYDAAFVRQHSNAAWMVNRETGEIVLDDLGKPSIWPPLSPEVLLPPYEPSHKGKEKKIVSVWQLLWERVEPFTPEIVQSLTGVPVEQLYEFARMLVVHRPVCYYSWNGLEQHDNSFETNRSLCILYTLLGSLGKKGGNRTLTRLPVGRIERPDWLPDNCRPRLGLDQRPLGAPSRSVTSYDLARAMIEHEPYPVRALLSFGGNLITQHPGSAFTAEALQQLEFHVHVDLFFSPMANSADILLPAAAGWETEGLMVGFGGHGNTARHVQFRSAVVPPPGLARPDAQIITDIGIALGYEEEFWHGDWRQAFAEMLAPLEEVGVTLDRLRNNPTGVTVEWEEEAVEEQWPTPSGKIEIYSVRLLQHGYDPLPQVRLNVNHLINRNSSLPHERAVRGNVIQIRYGRDTDRTMDREPVEPPPFNGSGSEVLLLSSYKIRYFCQSQHRGVISLRRQAPQPWVDIHPDTARSLNIADGDLVEIRSEYGAMQAVARLQPRVPRETVFTQAGWWEGCAPLEIDGYDPFSDDGANVNRVIGLDRLDPLSGAAAAKSYPCIVRKIRDE